MFADTFPVCTACILDPISCFLIFFVCLVGWRCFLAGLLFLFGWLESVPGWQESLSGWMHFFLAGWSLCLSSWLPTWMAGVSFWLAALSSWRAGVFWLWVKKKTLFVICQWLVCLVTTLYHTTNWSQIYLVPLHIFTAFYFTRAHTVATTFSFMCGFDLLCANPSRSDLQAGPQVYQLTIWKYLGSTESDVLVDDFLWLPSLSGSSAWLSVSL